MSTKQVKKKKLLHHELLALMSEPGLLKSGRLPVSVSYYLDADNSEGIEITISYWTDDYRYDVDALYDDKQMPTLVVQARPPQYDWKPLQFAELILELPIGDIVTVEELALAKRAINRHIKQTNVTKKLLGSFND